MSRCFWVVRNNLIEKELHCSRVLIIVVQYNRLSSLLTYRYKLGHVERKVLMSLATLIDLIVTNKNGIIASSFVKYIDLNASHYDARII